MWGGEQRRGRRLLLLLKKRNKQIFFFQFNANEKKAPASMKLGKSQKG